MHQPDRYGPVPRPGLPAGSRAGCRDTRAPSRPGRNSVVSSFERGGVRPVPLVPARPSSPLTAGPRCGAPEAPAGAGQMPPATATPRTRSTTPVTVLSPRRTAGRDTSARPLPTAQVNKQVPAGVDQRPQHAQGDARHQDRAVGGDEPGQHRDREDPRLGIAQVRAGPRRVGALPAPLPPLRTRRGRLGAAEGGPERGHPQRDQDEPGSGPPPTPSPRPWSARASASPPSPARPWPTPPAPPTANSPDRACTAGSMRSRRPRPRSPRSWTSS